MQKLKLQIDDLEVESFTPSRGAPGLRGTIRAHDWTFVCNTNEFTCVDCYTFQSCVGNGDPCVGATLVDHTCGNFTCNPGETCAGDKGCVTPG
jgi:hypothetical protein